MQNKTENSFGRQLRGQRESCHDQLVKEEYIYIFERDTEISNTVQRKRATYKNE